MPAIKFFLTDWLIDLLKVSQTRVRMGICSQPPKGSSVAPANAMPSMNSARALTTLLNLSDCRSSTINFNQRFWEVAVQAKCVFVLDRHVVLQIQYHRSLHARPSWVRDLNAG